MPYIELGLEYVELAKNSGVVIGLPKDVFTQGLCFETFMMEAIPLMNEPIMKDGLLPVTVIDNSTGCFMTFCNKSGRLPTDKEMIAARKELDNKLFEWGVVPNFCALIDVVRYLPDLDINAYGYNGRYYIRGKGSNCISISEFCDSVNSSEQYEFEQNINFMVDYTDKIKSFIKYEEETVK